MVNFFFTSRIGGGLIKRYIALILICVLTICCIFTRITIVSATNNSIICNIQDKIYVDNTIIDTNYIYGLETYLTHNKDIICEIDTNIDTNIDITQLMKDSSIEPIEVILTSESEPSEYVATVFGNAGVSLTDDEIRTLATLVYLEGGIESYECQKAICSVVINRMNYFNQTLNEVIYAPNQFSPADMIIYSTPSESTMQATLDVLTNGITIPPYVLYFRANYYFDWCTPYMSLDHTYFSYVEKVKINLESR